MANAEYRVIIAGSVSFQDYGLLRTKCDAILSEKQRTHSIVVVSGTARGADRLGERYAKEKGYQLRQFPADWDTHGRSAGPIRNGEMAKNADALIAFWNGHSSGTKNMIETAKRYGLPVRIILTEKPKEDKEELIKLGEPYRPQDEEEEPEPEVEPEVVEETPVEPETPIEPEYEMGDSSW